MEPEVAIAISEICQEFFVKNSINFDLIIYGNASYLLHDVIDGILKLGNGSFPTTIKNVKNVYRWNHELTDSAVILMTDSKLLKIFNTRSELKNVAPKRFKFIIYSENYDDIQEVPIVVNYFNHETHVSSFEYFIVETSWAIELQTIDHFMEYNCNSHYLNILNFFDKKSEKWDTKLQDYQKFDNFNGCMLTCTSFTYNMNFHFEKYNMEFLDCQMDQSRIHTCADVFINISHRSDVYRGLYFEVFQMLAKRGNFIPNYQFKLDKHNVSKSGIFVKQNLGIYRVGFHANYKAEFADWKLYSSYDIGVFVTPSEFYTNFEKLLLPFDTATWIMLAMTCIIITVVIILMKFMPKPIKISFYGSGINTPSLNITRIFFGIGQTQLPREAISRFILILFVLFCLIFRTCYQSMMFDFITTDMRKPPPRTLDEVIDQGFTFVMMNRTMSFKILQEMINSSQRSPNVLFTGSDSECIRMYCESIGDESAKLAFFITVVAEARFKAICKGSLTKLKDLSFDSMSEALFININSILRPTFDDVMEKIIPSGIPQYLENVYGTLMLGGYYYENKKSPKILNLSDLSFGFILWLISCGISLIGFLMEIFVIRIRNVFRCLIIRTGYYFAINDVFEIYYKMMKHH